MNFFKALALCHTCMVDLDKKDQEFKYQASSPDELALVQGANQVDIQLIERT